MAWPIWPARSPCGASADARRHPVDRGGGNFFARADPNDGSRHPRRIRSYRAAANQAGGRPRHHRDRARRQRPRRISISFLFSHTRGLSRRRSRARSWSAARGTLATTIRQLGAQFVVRQPRRLLRRWTDRPSRRRPRARTSIEDFGGTSGASAIIAGVAASLQAMTKAASKDSGVLAARRRAPAGAQRASRHTAAMTRSSAKIGPCRIFARSFRRRACIASCRSAQRPSVGRRAAHRVPRRGQPDGAPALHAVHRLGAAGTHPDRRRLRVGTGRPVRAEPSTAGGELHR